VPLLENTVNTFAIEIESEDWSQPVVLVTADRPSALRLAGEFERYVQLRGWSMNVTAIEIPSVTTLLEAVRLTLGAEAADQIGIPIEKD
jgi:hypothetical protein